MNELSKTGLELAHREQFTVPEWMELTKHVSNINIFDKARAVAAESLVAIRDKKLYRAYGSMKEFCIHTFGWSERRTQQMIASVKVIESLPKEKRTIVRFESHARELQKVPENQREEILEEAEHSTGGARKVTAKDIKTAATRKNSSSTSGEESKNGSEDVDASGHAVPKPAQEYWHRRKEAAEILAQLRYAKTKIRALKPDDIMWAEVNLGGVTSDLESAINRFRGGMPEYVCAHCEGKHPKGCQACKGRGVVSAYFWKQCVPDEMKEKREKVK